MQVPVLRGLFPSIVPRKQKPASFGPLRVYSAVLRGLSDTYFETLFDASKCSMPVLRAFGGVPKLQKRRLGTFTKYTYLIFSDTRTLDTTLL